MGSPYHKCWRLANDWLSFNVILFFHCQNNQKPFNFNCSKNENCLSLAMWWQWSTEFYSGQLWDGFKNLQQIFNVTPSMPFTRDCVKARQTNEWLIHISFALLCVEQSGFCFSLRIRVHCVWLFLCTNSFKTSQFVENVYVARSRCHCSNIHYFLYSPLCRANDIFICFHEMSWIHVQNEYILTRLLARWKCFMFHFDQGENKQSSKKWNLPIAFLSNSK